MKRNIKKPIRLYAAGKIGPDDWRGLRSVTDNIEDLREAHSAEITLDNGAIYVGPFYWGDDHRCTHFDDNHGAVLADECGMSAKGGFPIGDARRMLVANCQCQIARSDAVYARLDSRDAFGTFFEIGFAVAMGKPVFLDVSGHFETTADMWFMIQASIATLNGDEWRHHELLNAIPWWNEPRPDSVDQLIMLLEDCLWCNTRRPGCDSCAFHSRFCDPACCCECHDKKQDWPNARKPTRLAR